DENQVAGFAGLFGIFEYELRDAVSSLRHAFVTGEAVDLDHRKPLRGFDQIDAVKPQAEDLAAAPHQVCKFRVFAYRGSQLLLFGRGGEDAFDRVDVIADGVSFIVERLVLFELLREDQTLAQNRSLFAPPAALPLLPRAAPALR